MSDVLSRLNNTIQVSSKIYKPLDEVYQDYLDCELDFNVLAEKYDLDYSTLSKNGVIKTIKKYHKKQKAIADLDLTKFDKETLELEEKKNAWASMKLNSRLMAEIKQRLEESDSLFGYNLPELLALTEKAQKVMEFYKNNLSQDEEDKLTEFFNRVENLDDQDEALL